MARPHRRIIEVFLKSVDHIAHHRTLAQGLEVETPQVGESRVGKAKLALGAEHGNGLLQVIYGFALNGDQRVVRAFQRKFVG
mgnify:CR=1 FL=1